MRDQARAIQARSAQAIEDHHEVLASAVVLAYGVAVFPLAETEAFRATPGTAATNPQIAKFLRNADEQTVAAVVALLRAIESRSWQERSFADWGVVGCPRFLGRMVVGASLNRFFSDAKYSVSPHIIPNFSLHSPSGAVSVIKQMHGPNFGVGGGPGNVAEGLLTALSVMAEGRFPGLWLVLSEFDPEPRPDDAGKAMNDVHVHAAALALQPESKGAGTLRLTHRPAQSRCTLAVKDLVVHLASNGAAIWQCPVEGLGTLEFEFNGTPR